MKLPIPNQVHSDKITLSEKELNSYIEAREDNPLDHLIALLLIDGLLRPSEFGR